jgi:hypothetical protein
VNKIIKLPIQLSIGKKFKTNHSENNREHAQLL